MSRTAALVLLLSPFAVAQGAAEAVDYDRDIRPVLSARCFKCHGPDAQRRKVGLRLDTEAGMFSPRDDGPPVVVKGDPDRSELIRRVTHADAAERMPPSEDGPPLTERERQLLTEWVGQGAVWREHWAFRAPAAPVVPAVSGAGWPRGAVDRFVLAELESRGMSPSPTADRPTLIRRLTLDLTGLPPTLAEVDAFVGDRSPRAYEAVVDRLLGSVEYAEHMARYWLDAARYGDTHGLHLDNYREMWPYRDWVVAAFDRNLGYDQFVVEQLAGDLLEDATLEQQVASGFNRCHVTTNEGGSITEEVYVRNVVDRVSTTGTVFLGLTVGCAVCHDHKFDPISQTEFYGLFAFFNNLDGNAMDGNAAQHPPVVKVPDEQQASELAALNSEIAALEAGASRVLDDLDYVEPSAAAVDEDAWREFIWIDDALPDGAELRGDGMQWVAVDEGPVRRGDRAMKRVSNGNQQHFFVTGSTKMRVGEGDRLFAWVYLDPDNPPREVMLQWNSNGSDPWTHRAFWGEDLIAYGQTGTSERRRIGDLPPAGQWVRLEVAARVVGLHPGMVVHGMAFTQYDGVGYYDAVGINSTIAQEPVDHPWIDDAVPPGAVLGGDGVTWNWVSGPDHPVLSGRRSLRRSGGDVLNQDYFNRARPLRLQAGDRVFAHVWLDPADPPRSVQFQLNNGDWSHRVRLGDPAHGAGESAGGDYRAGPIPAAGEWVRIEVPIETIDLKPGDMVRGWAFTQVGGTAYWDFAGVRTWGPPDQRYLRSQAAWELRAVDDKSVPAGLRESLAIDAADRGPQQLAALRRYYLRRVHGESRALFAPADDEIDELRRSIQAIEKDVPTTLVMVERAEPRDAFVLERGQYDARGAKVGRITPAVLPPMGPEMPRDRLGLAEWLTAPDHPLTARVAVNRFWQQVFGVGLVKTSEDFGNQGERPSHPALLDWLATGFVEDGWDIKALMKQLVMSATYRQSSRITPELARLDPENRLLARGPRHRMDAEVLRDQALALGGLLVRKVGGPSVKPPQPDGLWYAVGYTSSNTAKFKADRGPDKIYRRSLYTFLKRTSPPPQMSTLDAPSRESCVVRRARTNTPLQALLLLNDPQYVHSARALAERMIEQGGVTPTERVVFAYRLATARLPSDADKAELVGLFGDLQRRYAADLEAARALVTVSGTAAGEGVDAAELAAWIVVANTVLNLDEVLTKS